MNTTQDENKSYTKRSIIPVIILCLATGIVLSAFIICCVTANLLLTEQKESLAAQQAELDLRETQLDTKQAQLDAESEYLDTLSSQLLEKKEQLQTAEDALKAKQTELIEDQKSLEKQKAEFAAMTKAYQTAAAGKTQDASDTPVSGILNPVLETIGSPSQSNKKICSDMLNRIPAKYIDRFISDGWHFYLTSEHIGQTYMNDSQSYQGLTVYDTKAVYIENRRKAVTEAPVHEFGHYVSHVTGTVSALTCSDTWRALYESEGVSCADKGLGRYATTNPNEYFAECFYYYILNPALLKQAVPNTYEYIAGLCSD